MLLDKPLQPNDVVTIKLITGEEIIARYEGQSEKLLYINCLHYAFSVSSGWLNA